MQSLSTFIRISGSIPEVKKNRIDQWLWKYCILRKIRAKQGVGEQVWFVPNTVERSGGSHKSRKLFSLI